MAEAPARVNLRLYELFNTDPQPSPPPQERELRLPSNPNYRTAGPGPDTKGMLDKIAALLVERDQWWREGKGGEKVCWLVENTGVSEEKARAALEACGFVVADAYKVLVLEGDVKSWRFRCGW